MRQWKFWGLLAVAIGCGLLLAAMDVGPGWDDTAITVGAIFLVTALLGVAMPRRAWVWALAVGCWIPLVEIAQSRTFESLIALVVAFIGAYTGALARRAFGTAKL